MAHHGGPAQSLPRTHRPRAPIMSVPAPLTAPLAPLRPPPPVSLVTPRPEADRSNNEYVETPFRTTVPPPSPPLAVVRQSSSSTSRSQRPIRLPVPPPPPPLSPVAAVGPHPTTTTTTTIAVIKQPLSASAIATTFSKEPLPTTPFECPTRPSIMCPECGRCRCNVCRQPRPLPSTWICNNHCFCSADAIIDYATCLCCVKGLFYHCSNDHHDDGGGESCADEPCGCGPEKRAARWGCLTALSCVLPCLLCYWPFRACKRLVETCYARHSRQGCRCPQVATPEKRLLDTSPDY